MPSFFKKRRLFSECGPQIRINSGITFISFPTAARFKTRRNLNDLFMRWERRVRWLQLMQLLPRRSLKCLGRKELGAAGDPLLAVISLRGSLALYVGALIYEASPD